MNTRHSLLLWCALGVATTFTWYAAPTAFAWFMALSFVLSFVSLVQVQPQGYLVGALVGHGAGLVFFWRTGWGADADGGVILGTAFFLFFAAVHLTLTAGLFVVNWVVRGQTAPSQQRARRPSPGRAW